MTGEPADYLYPCGHKLGEIMVAFDRLPAPLADEIRRSDSQFCPACVARELDWHHSRPDIVSLLLAHMRQLDRQWSDRMNRAMLRDAPSRL